jgi:hypothetical protein
MQEHRETGGTGARDRSFVPNTSRRITEKFQDGPNKPADFKEALDLTGATPVWMLNMVTSTLPDQLELLRHVKARGMSVELIELGAEFYLEGNEIVQEKFPSGADYAKEANEWKDSIKKYFPKRSAHISVRIAKATNPPAQ